MFKYGQYCPIAKAMEVVGDRWTLLIARDMMTGTAHFNDLERGLPGISRGLLADRLRRLERTGVVEKRTQAGGRHRTEYHLTAAGAELSPVINALLVWGAAWDQTRDAETSASDYIDLVPAGQVEASGELAYYYVERSQDGTGELTAPEQAGSYEVRYVLEAPGGRRVLARVPLSVQ